MEYSLTGKYYFRNTIFGLILYVEIETIHSDVYFKKAKLKDIAKLNIKISQDDTKNYY